MENIIENRDKNEYTCALGPKLLLIALKPLENDKTEIFDSIKGIEYLSTCFKSKFKSAETHVTYLLDKNRQNNFIFDGFDKIFKYYTERHTFDPKQFIIGFIGQNAFDEFKREIDSLMFANKHDVSVREITSNIRIFIPQVNGNRDFYVPYVVLPTLDEDYSKLPEILNATNIGQNIVASPYCNTKEIIAHLKLLKDKYEKNEIKGFRFNCKINFDLPKPKTEYFKIFDYSTNHEMVYCHTDIICQNDTREDQINFKLSLLDLLKTVPVCGDDIERVLSLYKFDGCENIKIVKEEDIKPDPFQIILDRPYFKITGNKNGEPSAWYTKWRKNVFYGKYTNKEAKREGYNDREKYEWIYDIEVFQNDWLFVAKTLDKKNRVICWNDPISLQRWIGNKILIGFNNAQYDDSVIRHALVYPYAVKDTLTVKQYSDALVYDTEDAKKYPELREEFKFKKNELCPPFLSWDISFHMPFDIRRNSLKKLTMSILNRRNYDSNVPFDTPRPLTEEERREVEKYCEMDVDNTLDLFLPQPGDEEKKAADPKYKMREFARDSYDIRWNLIVEYKMSAKTLINKAASFAGKVLCGEDAKPNLKNTTRTIDGKEVYYSIPDLAVTELAGHPVLDFYLAHQQDPNYIKEKFEYHMGGNDESHLYQFGFGGLHQALINYTGKNLCNFDVASLYPSLLIQYDLASRGMKNPDAYKDVYHTRIEAKHNGDTLLNLGLKLILNGSIGAFLSDYNPLYDTWSNSTVCVYGQLLLFILCKRLYEAGFIIVQTNTDGIMVEKRDDVDFMTICKKWEEETRLVLEYDDIVSVRQLNVNNYTTLFSNGKIKSKGVFLNNEKFSNAVSKILCNIAFGKPLLEGCKARDFVIFKRHGIGEIYDAITNQKLEGRSLAFVIGKASDSRTQAYYSRSRNEREVVKKDEKGKPVLDENGKQVTEIVHSISKISGFTEHMLLVDDVNEVKMEDVNTDMYIAMARNLLGEVTTFGPYYDLNNGNYVKTEEPACLQSLNPLKDAADEYPTKAGVVCQNFLFECDYLSREEQEELIKPIEKYTYRIVWSGSRSYHIVVRINKPCTSIAFKKIWYYLQNKLKLEGADEQCAFPNRYTRVPDFLNPKTGNKQVLYSENKYEFDLDQILEDMPRLKDELKQPTQYKGKVDIKALERHLKRLNFQEGNRFEACQKLSPILISQVSMKELLKMIPCSLEKNHLYVIRAKYYYWEKYKDILIKKEDTMLDESGEL